MPSLPRITVITPSLNQRAFIEETIQSVLSQNYPNLEYIVMDGGSTDGTLQILKRYEGKLRWFSERDRGQSDAINKGMRLATGDVLAFLNSDDTYEPGGLLRVGCYFADHPEAKWLTGRCRTIDCDSAEIRKMVTYYKNLWLSAPRYSVLLVLNYISQPATFWRREVMEKIGGFDESLRYSMDYDYWLRVGREFKLAVIEDYLASFRLHPESKAGSSVHAQFEVSFLIAQRYLPSQLMTRLHAIHKDITVAAYRLMNSYGLLSRRVAGCLDSGSQRCESPADKARALDSRP